MITGFHHGAQVGVYVITTVPLSDIAALSMCVWWRNTGLWNALPVTNMSEQPCLPSSDNPLNLPAWEPTYHNLAM
jgi:hypothetical protein